MIRLEMELLIDGARYEVHVFAPSKEEANAVGRYLQVAVDRYGKRLKIAPPEGEGVEGESV